MKTKEMFALIIRVVGVLGLVNIIHHLGNDAIKGGQQLSVLYFVKKTVFLLIGIYFIWGAPLLVKFAYSGEPKTPADKQGQ